MDSQLEIALITARVRLLEDATANNLRLCAMRLRRYIEHRYRSDQPRAPRGTPEGGQWIDDAIGTDRQIGANDVTMFGKLTKQVRAGSMLLCVCDLGSEKWVLQYEKDGALGCYDLLPQATIFGAGTRLNDN